MRYIKIPPIISPSGLPWHVALRQHGAFAALKPSPMKKHGVYTVCVESEWLQLDAWGQKAAIVFKAQLYGNTTAAGGGFDLKWLVVKGPAMAANCAVT